MRNFEYKDSFWKNRMIVLLTFVVGVVQKSVDLADIVKDFHTSIYLEKSASTQPRMSLSNVGVVFILFLFASLMPAHN